MKHNNRGFSMLELIIAFAILALVSVIVSGFVTSSTNSFRSVSANVNLQVESQLAMNQLQEYIIDCNGGLCFVSDAEAGGDRFTSSSRLYVLSRRDTEWVCHRFHFDAAEEKMYYSLGAVSVEAASATAAFGDEVVLADYVTGFSVELSGNTSALLTLRMDYGGKSFTGEQTTALRNLPVSKASLDQLLEACCLSASD